MLRLRERMDAACQGWMDRFACSSPACARPGRVLKRVSTRSFESIRLHSEKYCFPECFAPALESCFAQLLQSKPAAHHRPHRIPLGLLLLSRGEIEEIQLRSALAAQQSHGAGRIGEWIEHLGFAAGPQIMAALGAQWACPVLAQVPDPPVQTPLPLPLMRRFRMAAVHYTAMTKTMHIGFSDGIEYGALLAIEQALECKAQPCIVSSTALDGILATFEDAPHRADQMFNSTRNPDEMTRITLSYAAMLSALQTRIARCGEFLWVRLMGKVGSVNLLFPAHGPSKE